MTKTCVRIAILISFAFVLFFGACSDPSGSTEETWTAVTSISQLQGS
jgi:hypothetical protein